jgi:tetratricopeptide (TPR) repeat protein
MKKTRDTLGSLAMMLKPLRSLLAVLCLVLLVGCGESVDLKIEQARIAMANDRTDKALSLIDTVLSTDPTNRDALLIQAKAQVILGRLGPAKLILDRLNKSGPGDPEVSGTLLDWAVAKIETVLDSPTFAQTPDEVMAYDRARGVGEDQIAFLEGQGDTSSDVSFSRALLYRSDMRRSRLLIRYTRKLIEELGGDALVDGVESVEPDQAVDEPGGEPGGRPGEVRSPVTYAQQLEGLEADLVAVRGELLEVLESLLGKDPRHAEAADMYLRMLVGGEKWNRVVEQAVVFGGVTDLPVAIADKAVTALLMTPDSVMALDDRIELGWVMLRMTPQEQAESRVRRVTSARLFLVAGKTQKALPILGQLIEEGATDPDTFYMYAQVLYATGDFETCREVMSQMFPAMESVASIQLLYGQTLWRLGELDGARAALRTAWQLDPENKAAADSFASVMAQQGFVGSSGEDISAFYQLDPTNPWAIQLMFQHAAAGRDTQQIAQVLSDIEAREEHTIRDLELLYFGNDLLGRDNAAGRWAGELVAREPEELSAWKRLATTQLKQGDEAGMGETLSQIARRFPESPGPEQLTGELYMQAKQYERAVAALGAAVQLDGSNYEARILLARALAAIERFNSGLAHVQAVLEARPGDTDALVLGARIAYAAGQSELAAEYLGQIQPEAVDRDKYPALLARIYLSRGDMETAERISTDAISAGNPSPMLRLVLAGIYQERGDNKRAEEQLVALVRHFPDNTKAFVWVSQFYARAGQIDQGIAKLRELEAYNQPFSKMAQAGLLRSADRVQEAIAVLDPLLDKLIGERSPMAKSVADMLADLYKQSGDEASATAVYDRLYVQPAQAVPDLIRGLIETWDSDSPAKRIANLDAASARVAGDDAAVLIELSRRYAMIGRADQSLLVIQRGLAQTPEDEALLGVKAGVLVMLGRTSDAVDAYRRVMELSPENDMVQVRYARALSADGRRPEAEEVLLQLIRAGGPGGQAARAALLEMYQGLGLHKRVESMVNTLLDKLPIGEDPSLDRVIGKSLMAQGRYAEAQERLAGVAEGSAYYPSAQVLYAQSEGESGDIQGALTRIAERVQDPVGARRIVPVLLALDRGSELNVSLLSRADSEIDVEALPYDLAMRWLALRMKLADQREDWALAQSTLERVARLDDGDDSVTALRVVLMYRQGQEQEAALLLRQSPRLEGSAAGSLLAFGLGVKAPEAGRKHPMAEVLRALVEGDRGGLESAASAYSGVRTLFPDDLLAGLETGGSGGDLGASCREMAMATIAIEGRMPGLGESLCASAVQKAPANVSAYALRAAALIERGESIVELAERVRGVAPDSSLGLMLDAMGLVSQGDHSGAIEPLVALVGRHPDNPHLAYQLAQELNAVGRGDEAVAALTPIAEGDGPYRLAAMNDLAYLLAERGGEGLEEAVRMARVVLRALPTSPPVLDTAGWVEHRRGRDEAALSLMAQAITALSGVPEAHYHIGAVYQAMGQDRWARYHLGQAASGPEGDRGVREAGELLAELGEDAGVR